VLNGGAAREDGRARAGIVDGVDDGAEADGFGFTANGLDLFVGHTLIAAGAKAGGGEELDDVGAFVFGLADELAKDVDVAGALAEEGEDAGAGEHALVDAVADEGVDGGTDGRHVVKPPGGSSRRRLRCRGPCPLVCRRRRSTYGWRRCAG